MRGLPAVLVPVAVAMASLAVGALAQRPEGFVEKFEHPAIDYYEGTLDNPVTKLAREVAAGTKRLTFDKDTGCLRAVLGALNINADTQVAVFSQTSFQAPLITGKNPRTIYFNDTTAVGYVRGGSVLEIAAQDPQRGVVFYDVAQEPGTAPSFERNRECLRCHVSWDTLGVPGLFVLSTGPADSQGYASGGVVDQRARIADRWGSWYLTGAKVPMHSMGVVLPTLEGRVDLHGYLTQYSDIVALMVLEHQTRMTNLLTYIGWEARVGASQDRIHAIARELVDYMLFVNEAPLGTPIEGSSGFAARFASEGPRDSRGRSLRQFDLTKRLMKYPCSYMIYSPAFDALPAAAKTAIYARLREVLSGEDKAPRYGRLTAEDRQAVIEILAETKKAFAQYTPGLKTGRDKGR